MDELKKGVRDVEDAVKRVGREADGHQVTDDIGNAGDRVRTDLGTMGDDARRDLRGTEADERRERSSGMSGKDRP